MSIVESIQLLDHLSDLRKPTVLTPVFRERADKDHRGNSFWEKILKEQIFMPGNNIITTLAASNHSNELIDDQALSFQAGFENGQIAAHLIVWVNSINHTPGIASVPDILMEELSSRISESVNYLINKSGKKPVIFSLSGYGPKNNRDGLSQAAQSNELPHVHVVLPPKTEAVEKNQLSAEQLVKFYSPVNILTLPFLKSLTDVLSNDHHQFSSELIYQDTNPLLPGLKLKLNNSADLKDYLLLMKEAGIFFNNVYRLIMNTCLSIFKDIDNKNSILMNLRSRLEQFGLDGSTVQDLIKFGSNFRPTLRQVENLLDDKSVSEHSLDYLQGLRKKYQSFKKHLSEPKTRLNIRKVLKKLYNLNEKQVDIMLNFFDDQLISLSEGKQAQYTLSENIPWRFFIDDYKIEKNNIVVNNINVFPSFLALGSNTIENIADTLLKREG